MSLTPKNIKQNLSKALMLAKREVSVLVHDAVLLEGINFTLPEIQTLLDGVTVGGHKVSEQQIALNQARAWERLFDDVRSGSFAVTEGYVCGLHAVAGKEEALEWGRFRAGAVTIAGTEYMPPDASELPSLFSELVTELDGISDCYERATLAFLRMARIQFFYDVNKRMGRFVMNGILLSNGYPVINVPARRKLEFNQLMLDFYETNDPQAMQQFLMSCLDSRAVKIMEE